MLGFFNARCSRTNCRVIWACHSPLEAVDVQTVAAWQTSLTSRVHRGYDAESRSIFFWVVGYNGNCVPPDRTSSRQMLELATEKGRGGVYPRLRPGQYSDLKASETQPHITAGTHKLHPIPQVKVGGCNMSEGKEKTTEVVNESSTPGFIIDRTAPAGSKNSLGAQSVRDGRPATDDSVVEAMDEQSPDITAP